MNRIKLKWTVLRSIGFVFIGLMNTVWIRPEDIGTWKNYAGYAILIIALFDMINLIRQINRNKN